MSNSGRPVLERTCDALAHECHRLRFNAELGALQAKTRLERSDDILGMHMVRRLFALALAFAVTGAPVVTSVCDARCARHAGHPLDTKPRAAAHHHHSSDTEAQQSLHHDSSRDAAQRSTGGATAAVPRGCGHLDVVITEVRHAKRPPTLKGVLTTDGVTPLLRVLPSAPFDSRHSPPLPIRSVSPLRL